MSSICSPLQYRSRTATKIPFLCTKTNIYYVFGFSCQVPGTKQNKKKIVLVVWGKTFTKDFISGTRFFTHYALCLYL